MSTKVLYDSSSGIHLSVSSASFPPACLISRLFHLSARINELLITDHFNIDDWLLIDYQKMNWPEQLLWRWAFCDATFLNVLRQTEHAAAAAAAAASAASDSSLSSSRRTFLQWLLQWGSRSFQLLAVQLQWTQLKPPAARWDWMWTSRSRLDESIRGHRRHGSRVLICWPSVLHCFLSSWDTRGGRSGGGRCWVGEGGGGCLAAEMRQSPRVMRWADWAISSLVVGGLMWQDRSTEPPCRWKMDSDPSFSFSSPSSSSNSVLT